MTCGGEGAVVRTKQGWRLQGAHSALANRFLQRVSLRGLADGSERTYAFDLLRIVRWLHAQRRRPEQLGREDFYRFVRDLRGSLKAVTLNRLLRLLGRWVLFLKPEPAQPRRFPRRRWQVRSLPFVREPQALKRPLTDREVQRVAESLRTNRDRAILGLMWVLGLRIGEVLRLRQEDIDWPTATVHVHGKGNRERSLPLPEVAAALLRRYQQRERPPSASAAVFVVLKGARRGQPLGYVAVRRLWRYHRACLRLPQAHPHRFRHTFAANMIRQGMSVPSLMRLLGHAWPETTLRYVHFDDREVREHYEKALAQLARTRHGAAGDLRAVL